MSLFVTTWLWGDKYPERYVERLRSGVKRGLDADLAVCRPWPEDEWLTRSPGCFVRLRAFDPLWQASIGAQPGDRIVCLDLDLIVTGPLGDLFDRPEGFVILKGANVSNPCTLNASVWMLRAGYRPDVWSDFTPQAAEAIGYYAFPDDQRWFEHKMPDAGGWECGSASGIWGFGKKTWPRDNRLPGGAKIGAFPGHRDPSMFTHLDWVRRHWGD